MSWRNVVDYTILKPLMPYFKLQNIGIWLIDNYHLVENTYDPWTHCVNIYDELICLLL